MGNDAGNNLQKRRSLEKGKPKQKAGKEKTAQMIEGDYRYLLNAGKMFLQPLRTSVPGGFFASRFFLSQT